MKFVKCDVCGNTAAVFEDGKGVMICCGKPMRLLKSQITDTGAEKHVPVIEDSRFLSTVKVGSIEHPMSSLHHISWIAFETEDSFCLKFLREDAEPKAVFLNCDNVSATAYEYCTLHGLWSSSGAME